MEKNLNCPTLFEMDQTQNCYFQPNWDTSNDQNDPFVSALSSLVSSPTAPSNGPADGMMIRELIGRLGCISDSNKICTANNLPNYPSSLAPFNADPGFVERAARFSCFGNGNFVGGEMGIKNKVEKSGGNVQIDVSFAGNEKKICGISRTENGERVDSREGSSLSEQNLSGDVGLKAHSGVNSRKRKLIPKAKVKDSPSNAAKLEKVEAEVENEESNGKRSKQDGEEDAKQENTEDFNSPRYNNNNNNNKDAAKAEPPKDYIHVRARRGQATDSHSLAERVRREKISERMKFLQDLVPGCNKVTGKATVLDEIINYVQSLQRQVELLSMKLSTVNPRMEFNMDALLSKDMFQSRGSAVAQTLYPLDQTSSQAFPFGYQSSQQLPPSLPNGLPNGSENPFSLHSLSATGIRRNLGIQLPSMDGFGDAMTQVPSFWEEDLQSIVQMGIVPKQTQDAPGTLPHYQMKVEL